MQAGHASDLVGIVGRQRLQLAQLTRQVAFRRVVSLEPRLQPREHERELAVLRFGDRQEHVVELALDREGVDHGAGFIEQRLDLLNVLPHRQDDEGDAQHEDDGKKRREREATHRVDHRTRRAEGVLCRARKDPAQHCVYRTSLCGRANAMYSPEYTPPLTATMTNCRPLAMYDIGDPLCAAGIQRAPTSLPVALS